MRGRKIFAVGISAFAVFAISAAWLFFSNVAPASAGGGGESCTWTASSSQYMSDPTNWDNGSGTACLFNSTSTAVLIFTGTVTTTDAIWDAGLTEVTNVTIYGGEGNDYTGTITLGAAAATTSNRFEQRAGTVIFSDMGNFRVGENFTITSGTFYGASSSTVTLYGSGATLTVSSTAVTGDASFKDLTIASAGTVTLGSSVTTTNLTVSAGTLDLSIYDLIVSGNLSNSDAVAQTSGTVTMTGDDATLGGSGVTTIYNLTISGNTTTLAGNVTTTNVLTINADKELKGGTKSLTLSKASGIPFIITGMFTANTSNVNYTGTGVVSTTAATYYDLVFGAGTYFFSDNTTSTNSFTNSGTTTVWTDKYLYVPGVFDNNGTIIENGAIQHPLTSAKITNSTGTETAAFNATSDSVYVTVEDSDGNLDVSAVDTITGSVVTAVSLLSDSETITLTETGANTGVFRSAALPLTITSAATTNSGIFEVSFNGNLTLAFVDSKQSSDTGADTATFTATQYVTSGGSSGGGGSPSDTTPPTNTSVVIAAGAGSTDTTAVTLTLAATDASQMMISNASDFTGSTWVTYITTKTWTLTSGAGIKTVYAKFKDAAGNISAAVSDTIDSTATTTVVTPPSGSGCPSLVAGDMVKVTGKPAIYAVNSAMEILYFPSGDEFKSWRPTYGGYLSITQTCFDALSVPASYPAAVNYHPGSYVVKRAASDQLYAVEPGNTLAKITPAAATALYGAAYTTMTVADPFWPHYVNRGADIAAAKAHPGMLVKVGTVTYYVDANNQLREITTAGMTANGFQTRFVRTVPASAIEGLTAGAKITAEIKALTDKTQQTVE